MKTIRRYIQPSSVKFFLILTCISLVACSKHISIRKPLDVSKANQSVSAQFTVKKTGNYRFSFLFIRDNTEGADEKQEKILGNLYEEGVAINIKLRISKNDVIFLDETITAIGTGWGQTILVEQQTVSTAVRLIKILELPPGDYTSEITTLEDKPSFRETESILEISYFNPKH